MPKPRHGVRSLMIFLTPAEKAGLRTSAAAEERSPTNWIARRLRAYLDSGLASARPDAVGGRTVSISLELPAGLVADVRAFVAGQSGPASISALVRNCLSAGALPRTAFAPSARS